MADETTSPAKKSVSADWFVRGILTRIGEIFDRLTGRGWKPSSSLATSELIERLKLLLDKEAKDAGGGKMFVPHNIKLKMQWDKFSADSEATVKTLENELLVAAVDHINDKRYYTYAPLRLEIKTDYFTEGVKLSAGFDEFGDQEKDSDAAINVSIPDLKNVIVNQPPEMSVEPPKEIFAVSFTVDGKPQTRELAFADRERRSVGRTKENDLRLDDASVSKMHAALVLNSDKNLMVADTGSTNGTFVNGERIAYGRAFVLNDGDRLKFGSVKVAFERLARKSVVEENDVAEIVEKETSDTENNASADKRNAIGNQTIIIAPVAPKNEAEKTAGNIPPTEPRVVLDFEKQE